MIFRKLGKEAHQSKVNTKVMYKNVFTKPEVHLNSLRRAGDIIFLELNVTVKKTFQTKL